MLKQHGLRRRCSALGFASCALALAGLAVVASAQSEPFVIDLNPGPDPSDPYLFESEEESVLFTFNEPDDSRSIGLYRDDVVQRFQTGVQFGAAPALLNGLLLHARRSQTPSWPHPGDLVIGGVTLATDVAISPILRHFGDRVVLGYWSYPSTNGLVVTDGTLPGTEQPHVTDEYLCIGPPCLPFAPRPPLHIEALGASFVYSDSTRVFLAEPGVETPQLLVRARKVPDLLVHGQRAYFVAGFLEEGAPNLTWSLYSNDGVAGNTTWLAVDAQNRPVVSNSQPNLVLWRGQPHFFLPARTADPELALWTVDSDGRAAVVRERIFDGLQDPLRNGAISTTAGILTTRAGELWLVDTVETRRLPAQTSDLRAKHEEFDRANALAWADRVVFAGHDGDESREPWVTDGTERGTFRIADVFPGPTGSDPADFVIRDGRLFFSAEAPEVGRELVILSLDTLFPPLDVGITAPETAAEGQEVSLKATSSDPLTSTCWRFGDETTDGDSCTAVGDEVTHTYDAPGTYTVTLTGERTLPHGPVQSQSSTHDIFVEAVCPGCLSDGRFQVRVDWSLPTGESGVGSPIEFSDDTVLFWFFDSANIELAVKVLDGSPINGHYWLAHGALSDVEYSITVEDTTTGTIREIFNPRGELCGAIDVEALPSAGQASTVSGSTRAQSRPSTAGTAAACSEGSDTSLCLREQRFEVAVSYFDPGPEIWRIGRPIVGTDDTGMFWFFEPGNVELLVKILDGTAINEHHWLYYGALSDVEYRIEIRDRETGRVSTVENEAGDLCGGAFVNLLDE